MSIQAEERSISLTSTSLGEDSFQLIESSINCSFHSSFSPFSGEEEEEETTLPNNNSASFGVGLGRGFRRERRRSSLGISDQINSVSEGVGARNTSISSMTTSSDVGSSEFSDELGNLLNANKENSEQVVEEEEEPEILYYEQRQSACLTTPFFRQYEVFKSYSGIMEEPICSGIDADNGSSKVLFTIDEEIASSATPSSNISGAGAMTTVADNVLKGRLMELEELIRARDKKIEDLEYLLAVENLYQGIYRGLSPASATTTATSTIIVKGVEIVERVVMLLVLLVEENIRLQVDLAISLFSLFYPGLE